MSSVKQQLETYHETLIQEISLVAEATSVTEFTDLQRLETAKRAIRLLLRTTPGKYWIPPLAPEDRHLGITKGYFRTVKYFNAIMEADSTEVQELIGKFPVFDGNMG